MSNKHNNNFLMFLCKEIYLKIVPIKFEDLQLHDTE